MLVRGLVALLWVAAPVIYGAPDVQQVLNAARLDRKFCPGALAIVLGSGLNPGALNPVTIAVGGKPGATVGPVSDRELLIQLPLDLQTGLTTLIVTVRGEPSRAFSLTIDAYAPGFYSPGAGGVLFQDPNSRFPYTPDKPAPPGGAVNVFMVGLGATDPMVPVGEGAATPTPTVVPPQLTVGGKAAAIQYSGLALASPGVYLVSFTVPVDVSKGNQDVILEIGGERSPRAILPTSTVLPVLLSVANSATGRDKPALSGVAPNSFLSVFANNIGAQDSGGSIFPATAFNGVSVKFNGTPGLLHSVTASAGQINVAVPPDLPVAGTSQILVTNAFGESNALVVTLAPVDLGIFVLYDPSNLDRTNGAVLFGNTAWRVMPVSMATALGLPGCAGVPATTLCGQPARAGDPISIFLTGAGKATPGGNPSGPTLAAGSVAPADGSVVYETVAKPAVKIGGIAATVFFSGIAPAHSALYQVNTTVPSGVRPGDDVPLTITMGDSADTVTIAVR